MHSPDPENGLPRVRRPRHMGNAALTFLFDRERADLTFDVRTAEDAQDGFLNFRVPLDDYAVLDLSTRYRVTPHVELFVKGVNLTDEQYEEIDGFATVLPVYERIGLPAPDRADALARVYFRRGFLESAADEWIAAYKAGPEARFLVGLAQVAYAQGRPEDAMALAAGALDHEPDNAAARKLLDAVGQRQHERAA